jgi:hypothetical protein
MAAVSSSDIWAVGSVTSGGVAQTFTERWNGKMWAVVASPNAGTQNNHLSGVAAVSASDVWAVGDFQDNGVFQILTEHWDGTAWNIVASPSGTGPEAELNGVVAVSASDVWAVGDSGSNRLIEQWNGTSWTVVPSPGLPAGTVFNILAGAVVVTASDIWAVGESQNSSGIPATLTEHWDGIAWSIVASPAPGSASLLSGTSADPSLRADLGGGPVHPL